MRFWPLLLVHAIACGRGGFLEPHEATSGGDPSIIGGDQDGDDQHPGAALNWRELSLEQWLLVTAAMDDAAAQGFTGTPSARLVGPDLTTFDKPSWNGGVLGANGRIYAIPAESARVLEFDPATLSAVAVGPDLGTGNKWNGAVLAADGVIYGAPFDSDAILTIDTNGLPAIVDTLPLASTVTHGGNKWSMGTSAYNGKIYMAPDGTGSFLVLDPVTRAMYEIAVDTSGEPTGSGDWWLGGAIAPSTGVLYFAPYSARRVVAVDPIDDSVFFVGPSDATGAKWCGIVLRSDETIWGMPDSADGFLRIDTKVDPASVSQVGTFADSADGGVIAPDGRLFVMPWNTAMVRYFDFATALTAEVAISPSPDAATRGRWASGALAPNGKIYALPTNADQVLEIDPGSNANLPLDVLLSGFVNTY